MKPNRSAKVYLHGQLAGMLEDWGNKYLFRYTEGYSGSPISLTHGKPAGEHTYEGFPHFLEGLLPEGWMLESLLRTKKLNEDDYWGQLMVVGRDLPGALEIEETME